MTHSIHSGGAAASLTTMEGASTIRAQREMGEKVLWLISLCMIIPPPTSERVLSAIHREMVRARPLSGAHSGVLVRLPCGACIDVKKTWECLQYFHPSANPDLLQVQLARIGRLNLQERMEFCKIGYAKHVLVHGNSPRSMSEAHPLCFAFSREGMKKLVEEREYLSPREREELLSFRHMVEVRPDGSLCHLEAPPSSAHGFPLNVMYILPHERIMRLILADERTTANMLAFSFGYMGLCPGPSLIAGAKLVSRLSSRISVGELIDFRELMEGATILSMSEKEAILGEYAGGIACRLPNGAHIDALHPWACFKHFQLSSRASFARHLATVDSMNLETRLNFFHIGLEKARLTQSLRHLDDDEESEAYPLCFTFSHEVMMRLVDERVYTPPLSADERTRLLSPENMRKVAFARLSIPDEYVHLHAQTHIGDLLPVERPPSRGREFTSRKIVHLLPRQTVIDLIKRGELPDRAMEMIVILGTVEALSIFPPGILPLIASYLVSERQLGPHSRRVA